MMLCPPCAPPALSISHALFRWFAIRLRIPTGGGGASAIRAIWPVAVVESGEGGDYRARNQRNNLGEVAGHLYFRISSFIVPLPAPDVLILSPATMPLCKDLIIPMISDTP